MGCCVGVPIVRASCIGSGPLVVLGVTIEWGKWFAWSAGLYGFRFVFALELVKRGGVESGDDKRDAWLRQYSSALASKAF